MARIGQQTPSTGTTTPTTTPKTSTTPTTVPTYGGTGTGDVNQITSGLNLPQLPTSTPDSNVSVQYAQPIGVPPYAVDPTTHQILTEQYTYNDPATGKPVTATRYKPYYATVDVPAAGPPVSMGGGLTGAGVGYGYAPSVKQVPARYFEGDDLAILTHMLPEDRATLQQEMIDARILAKSPNIMFGNIDNETIAGFRQVLGVANASGSDYETVIQNWKQIAAKAPPPPVPPHVNRLSNAADLEATFRQAARATLGRALTPAEVQRYVTAFQAQEAAYGDASAAAQLTGGNVEAPPDPTAYAQRQARLENPQQANEMGLLHGINLLRSMVGGPTFRPRGTG